jgi:hypothetical protein
MTKVTFGALKRQFQLRFGRELVQAVLARDRSARLNVGFQFALK